MMKKYIKKRSIIIICSIILFALINLALTYSYYLGKVINNESSATLSFKSEGLKIVYQNDSPIINEENISPGWTNTKTFSISSNVQNFDVSLVDPKIWYNMRLIIDENEFSDGMILYSLTNTTTEENGLAAESFQNYEIPTGRNEAGLSLGSGYVEVGNNTHTYTLELKYTNSKDPEYNKKFSCHIVTEIVSNVKLNIDLDGGESSDVLERSVGKQTIVKLTPPTKAGCDFLRFEVVEGDGVINNNESVTVGNTDTRIKAIWNIRTINVHLDFNGGTSVDEADILAPQDSYIDLSIPVKDRHNFIGWELIDGTAEVKGSRIMTSTTDIHLKAKWEQNLTYVSLAVDLDGGTSSEIQANQAVLTSSGVTLAVPLKEGYLFDKWQVVQGDATVSGNTIMIGNENALIKAIWKDVLPVFTYLKADGSAAKYTVVRDTDSINNWRIRFLESGTLTFTDLGNAAGGIDVFLVGGGGAGGGANFGCAAGGGGGYTKTRGALRIHTDNPYDIMIGSGGSANADGDSSAAFDLTVEGGKHGVYNTGAWATTHGGAGGSGGGAAGHGGGGIGGSDGSNGLKGTNGGSGGAGQGTSTREFWEIDQDDSARLYSGGGGGGFFQEGAYGIGGAGGGGKGGSGSVNGSPGIENTGGGGGGGLKSGAGGSGIVVIRNKR